jgi:hypothetical protein
MFCFVNERVFSPIILPFLGWGIMWDEGITGGLECIVPHGSPLCLKQEKALRGELFTNGWPWALDFQLPVLRFAKPSPQGVP